MARSGSEDPRDVGNLERLSAELRGAQAEAERQLALAAEARKQAELEQGRARSDRQTAARETRARRRAVGTGGTPTGAALAQEPAVIEQSTAATNRATQAEQRRTSAVRERVRLEREAARQSRLPVLVDRTGFQVRQTPDQQIEAQGRLTQARLRSIQLERDAEAARDRAIQANNLRSQRLLGPGPVGGYPAPGVGSSGGGGRPPVVPPAPPGGPGEPPGGPRGIRLSDVSQLSAAEARLVEQARALTYTEDDLSRAIAYNSRVVGLSSNAYQKHGYLTSEFIQAAAKGQVTFRELGQQVGGTIGKFAGWTAAATAVYGALGAVQALGRGAIESANGVQLLNRVVVNDGGVSNDELQGRVGDLARKFNTPVADVNQAVYGSLKAFRGDLPQALAASEQALFAVKVGELSAADSTKYLTSIVNGFQLTAKDLPLLFDTINQAQNRFGGNTGQMVQGVAKAAGAFRLAGGDYRELIAILQTGTRLTGRSAVEVGTAVQRSAGRVLTPAGIEALKKAGLNPDQEYPKLLAQAAGLAQNASKQRVQELARALIPSGGQFASTFAPLLQNRQLYNTVFKELDPDKARGSASRELGRVLAEPGERLKQIGVDAERLGVTLSRLGAGALPGALLKSLDLVLNTTNGILEVVNTVAGITGPFKPLTLGALEFAAALKLIRRLDVGASLPVGRQGSAYSQLRGGLQRSPVAAGRAQVLQGLGDERKFIGDQRAQAAVRAATLNTQLGIAKLDVEGAKKGGVEAEIAQAQGRANALERQHLEATQLENVYREQALRVQTQINAIEAAKIKTMEELEAATASAGVLYTNPTLNRPVPLGPGKVGAAPPPPPRAPGVPYGPQTYRDAEYAAAAARASGGAPVVEGPTTSRATRALSGLERGIGSMSTRAATAGPIMRTGAGALTLLGNAALFTGKAANAGAVGLGNQAKAMYASFGALEKGLIVAASVYAIGRNISDNYKDANRVIGDLGSNDITRIRKTADYRTEGPLANAPIVGRHGFFGSLGGLFRNASDLTAKAIPGAQTSDDFKDDAQKAAAAEVESFNKSREKRVNLYQGEIQEALKKNLVRAGNDPAKQQAAIDQALKEESQSFANGIYGNKDSRRQAKEITDSIKVTLANLQAAQGQLVQAILAIQDAKGLDQFTAGVGARYDLGISSAGRTAKSYGYASARARELLASGQMSPEEAAQATQQSDQGAQKALEDQLARTLATTKDPGAQNRARGDFITGLRSARLGPIKSEIKRLTDEAKKFPDRAKANRQAIAELRRGLDYESGQIETTIAEQRTAQFETTQKVYDARTALIATRANDPVAALRIQLRRDRARLAAKAEQYGKGSAEYIAALNQAEQERQQLTSSIIDRYSSEQDLNVARSTVGASDQVKQQAALTRARNVLAFTQEHGGSADQVRQAAIAVYQAQDAIVSQVKQQADDLLDAQKALALSQLDPSNEFAAATVNLRYDRLALARADTPAARIRAQAQVNTDVQTRRDAKLQARASTVDFQLSMEQIDKETAAAEFDALARRVKNNKDLQRQYRLKAKELRDAVNGGSEGYALDISNIKLPTPYEVNRAIKEGRQGASQYRQSVVNNHRTNIRIEVKDDGDLAKVGDVLDTHLNTSTRSALRARGLL